MSSLAIPAEILDLESPDPPEADTSTTSEPRPDEERVEEGADPDERRGDVDDLPRAS